MEPNRGNDPKNPKKPEGDRPRNNYFTPLMIALVLVLVFSWVSNAVEKSQYNCTLENIAAGVLAVEDFLDKGGIQ